MIPLVKLGVLLVALLMSTDAASLVNGYACKPGCSRPDCVCPSATSPVPDPPQFIILTLDDALHGVSGHAMLEALKDITNPNGCPAVATFYVTQQYSLPEFVDYFYNTNHEIATHTMTHPSLPSRAEISGVRDWLINAGVPREEIRGFRAPFLVHDVAQRQTIHSLGFKYDGSITEKSEPDQLFPYTLDTGVAVDCTTGTGTCSLSESYPGMWSVPMWVLPNGAASMDVTGDIYDIYMKHFDSKYNGNRAPIGIFTHSPWLIQNRVDLRRFLKEARKHDDVWIVTNWQLLEWMRNPVSAAEYKARQTQAVFCPRKPKGSVPPKEGCMQGTWDPVGFRCVCSHSGDTQNGYCLASDGTCSVPKVFDAATRSYPACSGPPPPPPFTTQPLTDPPAVGQPAVKAQVSGAVQIGPVSAFQIAMSLLAIMLM